MNNLLLFLLTLAVIACLNGILALGFNLQFGHAGILNFAFIVLVAVGAYMTGIAAIGPAPNDGFTSYIGGFGWGFPWDVLFGTACTIAFAVVMGGLALRRLRHDYLALTLFIAGQGLLVLVTNDVNLFDGSNGLTGIPAPWQDQLSPVAFQLVFLWISALALVVVYYFIARLTRSPLGRALKSIREDEVAAASLSKPVWRMKMTAFLVGAAAAGLGGSLLAVYTSGWSPQGWLPQETIFLLAAVTIGGRGRNAGALLGSLVVMTGVVQASQFLPVLGNAEILPELQAILIGSLLLAFLWWRPQGILGERKERFPQIPVEGGDPSSDTVALFEPSTSTHAPRVTPT
jgi:branched-chain amino acid transport system permease protein